MNFQNDVIPLGAPRTTPYCRKRAGIVCLAFLTLALAGCDEPTAVTPPQRPVKTMAVMAAQPSPALTWMGSIEPMEEITLQFRNDGKLAPKSVDTGMKVTRDQAVARLVESHSKEDAAASQAEYQEALAAESRGRQELKRVRKLYTIGTASQAQQEEAVAALAALSARRIRAEAQNAAAKNESEFSTLRSPVNGFITAYLVQPGQNVTAGQDVIRIASEQAEVQFSISSPLSASLHPGDRLSVRAGQQQYSARIRYLSPQLDTVTRTRLVRATLDPATPGLIFGTPAVVSLPVAGPDLFTVPATALTRRGDQTVVFVVNEQKQTLEARTVRIARFSADAAYLSAGLRAGERVVTAGVNTLENGEHVKITSEAAK
ncbi:MAG: efflux RND transporter periplasmic adaptor subunit [Kluyvera sp.]|uniref:efflux RND transporter periplasmic adaptor subunit n=1 Tax=Kluyvera sp. TaxID=1538228 RepID=UPI003F3760A8